MSNALKRQMILANPWFEQLPDSITEEMIALSSNRSYADGEQVHGKGDEAECIFGIVSGVVRISNVAADGKEAVLTLLEPGSWFGEIALFDGLPRTHDAFAQGQTEILVLPSRSFHQLMDQHPKLYQHFNLLLCQRIRLLFSALSDQALLPLSQRLIKQLLQLAETYGKTTSLGVRIGIKLPQEDLGLMLGASRQSINKELKKLENTQLILPEYGSITLLDINGLRKMLDGGEYSPSNIVK